jgi:hypothetical protein
MNSPVCPFCGADALRSENVYLSFNSFSVTKHEAKLRCSKCLEVLWLESPNWPEHWQAAFRLAGRLPIPSVEDLACK